MQNAQQEARARQTAAQQALQRPPSQRQVPAVKVEPGQRTLPSPSSNQPPNQANNQRPNPANRPPVNQANRPANNPAARPPNNLPNNQSINQPNNQAPRPGANQQIRPAPQQDVRLPIKPAPNQAVSLPRPQMANSPVKPPVTRPVNQSAPGRPAVNQNQLQHIIIDDEDDGPPPPQLGPSMSQLLNQSNNQSSNQPRPQQVKREPVSSQNSQNSGFGPMSAARRPSLNLSQQSAPPGSPSPANLGVDTNMPESEKQLRAQAQNLREEALEDEQRWQKTTTDVFEKQDQARKHRLTFVRVNQTKRDCTMQTHKQIVDLVPLFVECYTESQAEFIRHNFQVVDRLSSISSSIVSEQQAREQAAAENTTLPFAESFAAMDKQLEGIAIRDEEESKEESKQAMDE